MDKPQAKKVIWHNLQGQIILQESFTEKLDIPIAHLARGVYVLKIISQTEVLSQKIVIQ